jgi:hypothetical protein
MFLSVSPPLREATADQIETFNQLALKGALHALRCVIHLTCPSVVMATLVLHRVIDSSYIDSLSPLLEQPFEVVRTVVGGVQVQFSTIVLARLDMNFHALSRDLVLQNFRRSETASSWGAYIGAAIYKAWLQRLAEHKSELTALYAQEHYRPLAAPLAAVPSLASSSSFSSSSSSCYIQEWRLFDPSRVRSSVVPVGANGRKGPFDFVVRRRCSGAPPATCVGECLRTRGVRPPPGLCLSITKPLWVRS